MKAIKIVFIIMIQLACLFCGITSLRGGNLSSGTYIIEQKLFVLQ